MKVAIPLLLALLGVAIGAGLWYLSVAQLPGWIAQVKAPLMSTLFGGLGGVAYCLRAVYLNMCVHKRWSPDWYPWYFIRPIVSLIFGGVSYPVLKAGLLFLDADHTVDGTNFGFVALAFIAGFNVDRFVRRMEDAAKATFGIQPSRTSERPTDSL